MIIAKPDPSLDFTKLDSLIAGIGAKLNDSANYFLREKYVDRGRVADPFHIVRFREKVDSVCDDLRDEELFCTAKPEMKIVHQNRLDEFDEPGYWKKVSGQYLRTRLDYFMNMCRNNFLQPTGFRTDNSGNKTAHPKFKAKPFVFEISSPWSSVVGVSPLPEGALANFGAIEGTLSNLQNMEIVVKDNNGKIVKRIVSPENKFWFAQLPPGKYKVSINGFALNTATGYKSFGRVKGNIKDQENKNHPLLHLQAPDDTVFPITPDSTGNFQVNLPAFKYKVTVPGHWFQSKVWVEVNVGISGSVKDQQGNVIAAVKLLLKKDNALIAEQISGADGSFRFVTGISGKFSLEAKGYSVFVKPILSSRTEGIIGTGQTDSLELLAKKN